MTLKDFMESYEGFDWNSGEIVIVNQRTAKVWLCESKNGNLSHVYHDLALDLNMEVYSWTHSKKTMVITL